MIVFAEALNRQTSRPLRAEVCPERPAAFSIGRDLAARQGDISFSEAWMPAVLRGKGDPAATAFWPRFKRFVRDEIKADFSWPRVESLFPFACHFFYEFHNFRTFKNRFLHS